MIFDELQCRREYVIQTARAMMAAARTAPKARGTDFLTIKTITGDDYAPLLAEMRSYGEASGRDIFFRDALNVEQAEAVVLLGTSIQALGLDCGFCGFATCSQKNAFPNVPCAFNTNDMGLAVGSAVSIAADRRIDNRVMYTAGLAALRCGLMDGCNAALGIILTCTSKNPCFDRNFKK